VASSAASALLVHADRVKLSAPPHATSTQAAPIPPALQRLRPRKHSIIISDDDLDDSSSDEGHSILVQGKRRQTGKPTRTASRPVPVSDPDLVLNKTFPAKSKDDAKEWLIQKLGAVHVEGKLVCRNSR
jgi:hypothetical protein